jgi:hypothetical protein
MKKGDSASSSAAIVAARTEPVTSRASSQQAVIASGLWPTTMYLKSR